MNNRSINVQKIRPNISSAKITDSISADELFQNKSLRPILKLQNELFLYTFQSYIEKRKNIFHQLNLPKRIDYIASSIQKDLKFRNYLIGMVVGHFTIEEYKYYIPNSSAIHKRIMNMLIKRIQDQIQFFKN